MLNIIEWNENTVVEDKNKTIFIEQHPQYPTFILTNSFNPFFIHQLKDIIDEYKSFPALKLDEFYSRAQEEGYEDIILLGDVKDSIKWIDDLDETYPLDLNITLKIFQLRGFNFIKDLKSSVLNWSTGTGKSVLAVAYTKYLLEQNLVDKVVVVSKNHNKINWQRQFKNIGNLHAEIGECNIGTTSERRDKREEIYKDADIFIINYEKFRIRDKPTTKGFTSEGRKRPDPSGDGQEIMKALTKKRVLWIWDEMPTKMKSMSTAYYRGIQKIMRQTDDNYQIMLSAKKIEASPENIYTCFKILDPTIWPNIATFRKQYAKRMSSFSPWQVAAWDPLKLKELGMRISHMTHIANKYTDPQIKAEFPEEHWEDVIIDMSYADQKLYKLVEKEISSLPDDFNTILTRMNIMQQLCNNPATINISQSQLAQYLTSLYKFSDTNCAKLETLKELLEQIEGKVVIFSMFNNLGSKMLIPYLVQWGHTLVHYHGLLKQSAEDKFRSDPNIKIFLSSDQGSDSINLEKATTVINYDMPYNYSTLIQRVNRINRITSEADHVYYYNLIVADSIEERKLKILDRKRLYEEAVDQDMDEQAEILATTSLEDLKWVLFGR